MSSLRTNRAVEDQMRTAIRLLREGQVSAARKKRDAVQKQLDALDEDATLSPTALTAINKFDAALAAFVERNSVSRKLGIVATQRRVVGVPSSGSSLESASLISLPALRCLGEK